MIHLVEVICAWMDFFEMEVTCKRCPSGKFATRLMMLKGVRDERIDWIKGTIKHFRPSRVISFHVGIEARV